MLPPFSDILRFCEVPVVWGVIRPALPPLYQKIESIDQNRTLDTEGQFCYIYFV